MDNTKTNLQSEVADALWMVLRECEDRCDLELEDVSSQHVVWQLANIAIGFIRAGAPLTAPVATEQVVATSAFQKALDIRIEQGWQLGGNACPVLYTDTINGQQVCRDDLWLATTAGLKGASPEAAQSAREETVRLFEMAVSNCARLHTEYMGKAMTDKVYDRFATLRDDSIPALRKQLLASSPEAAPAAMDVALAEAKALADSEGSRAVKYLRVIRKVRAVLDEWPEVDLPESPLSRIRTIVAFAGTQTTAKPTAAPMCRDCADFGPICPNSGKPCATTAATPPKACEYCDDTGDVHGLDGEWRGICNCPAGDKFRTTAATPAAPSAAPTPEDDLLVACITLNGTTLTVEADALADMFGTDDEQHAYELNFKRMTRAAFEALGEFNGF